ncbi:MAG: phosphodiester glycosidase family protein [bacterium]
MHKIFHKIKSLPIFICLFYVVIFACSVPDNASDELQMNWQPVESLNANLPDGVRVYRGENKLLPLRAWYVVIDEPHPDIETRVVASDDRTDNRETVSSFAHDLGACVVVNGGYFTMNRRPARHVGLLLTDGKTWQPATPSVRRDTLRYQTARAAIGFTADDEVNITWVTTRNDTHYSWATPPKNRAGQPAPPLDYSNAQPWQVRDAVSGGPALLFNKRIQITADEEVFFGTSIPKVHPRTAAGKTAEGALILMVVDGRQAESRGVDLRELATLMKDAGAVEAINLDGGGSSTLVVNDKLINRPAGGVLEREVMSALATFCQ